MSAFVTAPSMASARRDPMLPDIRVVRERYQEAPDRVTLTLGAEARVDAAPAPRPGQFMMLSANGIDEVPISVSRIAADGALVHTIRDVGPVTRRLCALEVGASVGVRGPFGTPWNVEAARGGDVIVVAGGLGLAPLRPVIEHIAAHRAWYGALHILIGTRTIESLCFRGDVAAWAGHPATQVALTVDRGDAGWAGLVGPVTALIAQRDARFARAIAYVCGPDAMMLATGVALQQRGMDAARIQVSLERNMRCGIGHCGHCQLGPLLLCRDGPVVPFSVAAPLLAVEGL